MLTAQEIRSTAFEVVKRGYTVEDVDSFLRKVAGEFDALQSECAAMLQEKAASFLCGLLTVGGRVDQRTEIALQPLRIGQGIFSRTKIGLERRFCAVAVKKGQSKEQTADKLAADVAWDCIFARLHSTLDCYGVALLLKHQLLLFTKVAINAHWSAHK